MNLEELKEGIKKEYGIDEFKQYNLLESAYILNRMHYNTLLRKIKDGKIKCRKEGGGRGKYLIFGYQLIDYLVSGIEIESEEQWEGFEKKNRTRSTTGSSGKGTGYGIESRSTQLPDAESQLASALEIFGRRKGS